MEIKDIAIEIEVLSDESLGQVIGGGRPTPGQGVTTAASAGVTQDLTAWHNPVKSEPPTVWNSAGQGTETR